MNNFKLNLIFIEKADQSPRSAIILNSIAAIAADVTVIINYVDSISMNDKEFVYTTDCHLFMSQ